MKFEIFLTSVVKVAIFERNTCKSFVIALAGYVYVPDEERQVFLNHKVRWYMGLH